MILAVCGASLVCASCSKSDSTPPKPPIALNTPDPELLKQADECYAAREDLQRVRDGLEALRRARAVAPNDYDATWRAARLNYTLGDYSKDDAEKEKAFRDGIEAGETAVRADPNKPEGHFWLGANQGGFAQLKGPIYGLSAADGLRKEMETVLKLDESFQAGSAFMVLGRLDLELPTMLGGDPDRAVATLERGMKYGEPSSLYHLRLAEAYLRVKRMNDARAQLNYIINMKPLPDYVPEYKEAVAKARELLDKRF